MVLTILGEMCLIVMKKKKLYPSFYWLHLHFIWLHLHITQNVFVLEDMKSHLIFPMILTSIAIEGEEREML